MQSRKQARRAEFYRRANARRAQAALRPSSGGSPLVRLASFGGSPTAAPQFPACYGGGEAAIATYDPIFIKLVETYTWGDWWFDGYGSYSAYAGGSCWANPNTGLSTWYVGACSGDLSTSLSHALAATDNYSYNWDFGFNNIPTEVADASYVYQTNGYPGWQTFHDDWGEFSEIIFGWTLLGYSWC